MKTKFYLMTMIALAMIACGERNTPSTPNGNGNGGGGNTSSKVADFEFDKTGLMVTFTNKSSTGLSVYSWNFGDGTSVMGGNHVTHDYSREGTYQAILTCVDNNNKQYKCTKEVYVRDNITNSKEVYIKGYAYYNIPYDNRYYKITIAAYSFNGKEDFKVNTSTQQIEFVSLPSSWTLKTPYYIAPLDQMVFYDHFTVWVYQSTSSSGNGTQCLKQDFVIDEDNPKNEYVVTSNNGETKVGIRIEYRDY